ncbi:hypothetical protein PPL_03581 [Heterostelium album PN500]|uniref:Uncharacterized protein n=1 Tax=Heterostelium pallidum (strain ATCC 26659 / Pp 5 / PN500) TaxID=670386 RepID=D3B569_HETP5|nr:hypothetical protein PPL_03581 [Heterostelium album PN500]EFA83434.1 hypothetical protein PPL_03581 [Heterostelium album PN500]|eukprot:XP_020435551.1 hypothetical protein PPL_03581 [Heterostelium album PN500]
MFTTFTTTMTIEIRNVTIEMYLTRSHFSIFNFLLSLSNIVYLSDFDNKNNSNNICWKYDILVESFILLFKPVGSSEEFSNGVGDDGGENSKECCEGRYNHKNQVMCTGEIFSTNRYHYYSCYDVFYGYTEINGTSVLVCDQCNLSTMHWIKTVLYYVVPFTALLILIVAGTIISCIYCKRKSQAEYQKLLRDRQSINDQHISLVYT